MPDHSKDSYGTPQFTQVVVKGENGAIGNLWQRSDGRDPFAEITQEGGFFCLYLKRKVRTRRAGRFTTLAAAMQAVPTEPVA